MVKRTVVVMVVLLCMAPGAGFAEKGYEKIMGGSGLGSMPPGWSKGEKNGWGEYKLPPGLQKKVTENPTIEPPKDGPITLVEPPKDGPITLVEPPKDGPITLVEPLKDGPVPGMYIPPDGLVQTDQIDELVPPDDLVKTNGDVISKVRGYEKFSGDDSSVKRPNGWSHGEKTGWGGNTLPPGLQKKVTDLTVVNNPSMSRDVWISRDNDVNGGSLSSMSRDVWISRDNDVNGGSLSSMSRDVWIERSKDINDTQDDQLGKDKITPR